MKVKKVEWELLDVARSEEHETIVVYYYEVGSSDAAEIEQIAKGHRRLWARTRRALSDL